jgi:uncharacterized protein (DUF433 family)
MSHFPVNRTRSGSFRQLYFAANSAGVSVSRSVWATSMPQRRASALAQAIENRHNIIMVEVLRTPHSWILKTPGVCGGDACIRHTRIAVCVLVEERLAGRTDAEILNAHPTLTAADLQAAWTYYDSQRAEIDAAIQENAQA